MDNVIKLKELLEATPVGMKNDQSESAVKQFVGKDIEIAGVIRYISDNEVKLANDSSYGMEILFDKEKFGTRLHSFVKGDSVSILANLTSINSWARYYRFSLTSIEKTESAASPASGTPGARTPSKSKTGCFIATACYEDYDAQEVLVLRRFRDEILLKTFPGKIFVKFYYLVSPFLASLISRSDIIKRSVRKFFLDPIVTKLQLKNK